MKIYVKPRRFFEYLKNSDLEDYLFSHANVISVITPAYSPKDFQDELPPFNEKYWQADNVCIIKFHDAERQVNDMVHLIEAEDIDKIWEFCNKIDKSKPLYIHCTAGKSRSQAIGFVLNKYFNKDNPRDYEAFELENSSIRSMNSLVKKMMTEKFLKNS